MQRDIGAYRLFARRPLLYTFPYRLPQPDLIRLLHHLPQERCNLLPDLRTAQIQTIQQVTLHPYLLSHPFPHRRDFGLSLEVELGQRLSRGNGGDTTGGRDFEVEGLDCAFVGVGVGVGRADGLHVPVFLHVAVELVFLDTLDFG